MVITAAVRWLVVAVLATALLSIAAFDSSGPTTPAERVQRLSDSFACPQCDGQSVSESNAAVAATIRDFIRNEVADGKTDLEIRDQLLRSYGEDVLLNPPADGASVLIWILPVVVAVGGGAVVANSLLGDRRRSPDPTEDDHDLVARARADRR